MEEVLVVKREYIEEALLKFKKKIVLDDIEKGHFMEIACRDYIFMNRDLAENDECFKQIIPYAFLTYKENVFVLRRLRMQNETRLHNKISIGVGGHINPKEYGNGNIIENGLFRELNEEINIKSTQIITTNFYGVINDDSNEVGKVHLGFVYQIELANMNIEILEKDKMVGEWIPKKEILDYYKDMETWSQIIMDTLI
ncbi:hypothetical protein ACIQWQ_04040 [Peribacillus frigoritolerans]